MSNLFQDTKTGQLVEFVSKHDKDYAMVKGASGAISYVSLGQLVPYDAKTKKRLMVFLSQRNYLKKSLIAPVQLVKHIHSNLKMMST